MPLGYVVIQLSSEPARLTPNSSGGWEWRPVGTPVKQSQTSDQTHLSDFGCENVRSMNGKCEVDKN